MKTAAPSPSPAVREALWISVHDRIPQYQDGEDGMRVLVLTADHDFAGVQVHDIPASDFYAYDPGDDEPGTEVTKVATHWMPRHDLIAAARSALSQPPEVKEALSGWVPLQEVASERQQFDASVKVIGGGDVRLTIAETLRIWSKMHPGGSYAESCVIMANEVAKLYLAPPTTASAGVPSEPANAFLTNCEIHPREGESQLGADVMRFDRYTIIPTEDAPPAPPLQPLTQAGEEPARVLHSVSSVEAELLIQACVPGGNICDPQEVADNIRRYLNQWPEGEAVQPATSIKVTYEALYQAVMDEFKRASSWTPSEAFVEQQGPLAIALAWARLADESNRGSTSEPLTQAGEEPHVGFDDDGEPYTVEALASWLDAKYRRHGEEEDRAAAAMLRALAPQVPQAPVQPRVLHSVSSVEAELLIQACVPGGNICDPQEVADNIRRYLNQWPEGEAVQPATEEKVREAAEELVRQAVHVSPHANPGWKEHFLVEPGTVAALRTALSLKDSP